jgi:hypothetical protein
MRRVPDNLIKVLKYLALIVDQKFRKAHHVHEQDMGDFEMKVGCTLRSHLNSHGERASKDTLANRRPTVERKLRLSKPPRMGGATCPSSFDPCILSRSVPVVQRKEQGVS